MLHNEIIDIFRYNDLNRLEKTVINNSSNLASSERYSQMAMFFDIIRKRCDRNRTNNGFDIKNNADAANNATKENESTKEKQSEGLFHRLFNFPINPILEKAEYWREKLSVRAMAPFRHTFNELELFAKSGKAIMILYNLFERINVTFYC